jgi:integrase
MFPTIRLIRPREPFHAFQSGSAGPRRRRRDEDARVLLIGRPVEALREWLSRAAIDKGPVFRAIDQWGGLGDKAMTPQAVNWIVKRRAAAAGLDPKLYSAHGLRSGYLSEAARAGISLPEAMQQSRHRSIQQAAS